MMIGSFIHFISTIMCVNEYSAPLYWLGRISVYFCGLWKCPQDMSNISLGSMEYSTSAVGTSCCHGSSDHWQFMDTVVGMLVDFFPLWISAWLKCKHMRTNIFYSIVSRSVWFLIGFKFLNSTITYEDTHTLFLSHTHCNDSPPR
jgi:hypothetical protein